MNEVDVYLAKVSSLQKEELERIRLLIRTYVPEATEGISYAMPGFKYKGKYLITYAAFKDHMSVFPGAAPSERLKDKLKNYKTSKGTVQFTLEKPLPDELLKEMLNIRIREIEGR